MASVGGFVLLAAFAAGAAYADDAQLTFPVTAADAARMLPFGGSAGSAASPAAGATSSAGNADTAAAPSIVETAPHAAICICTGAGSGVRAAKRQPGDLLAGVAIGSDKSGRPGSADAADLHHARGAAD